MAKGYTFTDLPKPTGCTATKTAGGTLTANTTYYYRVFGVYNTNTGASSIYTWLGKSLNSDEFSATTDTTNKSMTLVFSSPVGACGSFRIMRSTTSGGYAGTATSYVVNVDIKDSVYNSGGTVTYVDTGTAIVSNNTFINLENVSHGRLTLSGSTSGDKFSIVDLYNADVAAGWGVITKVNTNTYKVSTYVLGHTNMYWFDTYKTILWEDGFDFSQAGSNVQFGQITSGRVSGGCNLLASCQWLSASAFQTLNAYFTRFDYVWPFTSTNLGQWNITFNAGTIQNCSGERPRNFTPAGTSATCFLTNFTMVGFDNAFSNGAATFSNVQMIGGSRPWQLSGAQTTTGRGVTLNGNTYAVLCLAATTGSLVLIDSTFSGTAIGANTDSTGFILYDKISYNLKVEDAGSDTAISGATVSLYDVNSTLVFTTTTAADGTITEQLVTRRTYGVNNVTQTGPFLLYPFKLIIQKSGYQNYIEYTSYTTSVGVVKTVALTPLTAINATTIYDSTIYDSTIY